jgi:hypothetical protein
LLETRQELNNPLVIADKMPVVGEKIYFVGWPLGVELKSEGKYLGDLDGPDNHYNDDVFDAPCDHGASGSAMFTSRGVWGVLVRIRTDNDTHDGLLPSDGMREGSEGGVAIPLKELVNFLKEGNVDYTATPESPSVDIPDEV